MPETNLTDELRARALDGAGQAELLDMALAAGLNPYQAAPAVADALHRRDLRRSVLDFMASDPAHARSHRLRTLIRDSAAERAGPFRSPAELEAHIESTLRAVAGDLQGWPWIRDALVDDALTGMAPEHAELVRDCAQAFGGAPALPSAELAMRVSGRRGRRWTAKALAEALSIYGIGPARFRLDGELVRGYRRQDFEPHLRAA